MDGGIGPNNIDECAKAGANWIVAGSSVFKAKNPQEVIVSMKRSIEKHGEAEEREGHDLMSSKGNGKADADLTPLPA